MPVTNINRHALTPPVAFVSGEMTGNIRAAFAALPILFALAIGISLDAISADFVPVALDQ